MKKMFSKALANSRISSYKISYLDSLVTVEFCICLWARLKIAWVSSVLQSMNTVEHHKYILVLTN